MAESITQKLSADLAKLVCGDVFSDILHRAAFSSDASIYRIVPACVVVPREVGDIVNVIKYAGREGIPVVARGAGSGVAGESLCSGIVFDMRRYMNRIISVSDDGRYITCEPGAVLNQLNDSLKKFGRKIGPDPSTGNRATIGGCVANNATGAHSLEYGYIGDYVECIDVVLADGSVAKFENDIKPKGEGQNRADEIARKCLSIITSGKNIIQQALPETTRNRSGYTVGGICHDGKIDMAKLLAGSEGTLAIFTKIKLRTVEVPKAKVIMQLEFDSLEKMAEAAPIIAESGASACELMDKILIDMAREALPEYRSPDKSGLPADAEAILSVEHTGDSIDEVMGKIRRTEEKIGKLAAGKRIISDKREQARIEKARKDAVPLLYRKKGRKQPIPFIEDVSVGNNNLGKYIAGLKEISQRYDITMSFYGHAGDGELHVRPYLDLGDPADINKMLSIANDVFSLAWSLGGTISGEHADGLVRAAFIKRQYGEKFYELLCEIKRIFDPKNILNPGKIINDDPEIMTKNLQAGHKLLSERLETDLYFEPEELALELEKCNGCGLCLSRESDIRMCPVFRAVGDELGSSRSKANILRFWATGDINEKDFESPKFREFLDLCVNCKVCQLQCPSGVDISKLVTAARAELAKRKGLPRVKKLLSRNRVVSVLGSLFAPISNFVMRIQLFRWFLEKVSGLDSRRKMPKFMRGSFLSAGRKYLHSQKPINKPVDKVAYFVDTYANYNDHELGFAVLKVLRHNNIEVILPDQLPSPLPAIVYGDVKTARKDLSFSVKHLAKAVKDGYKIVCSEPSAALCLKEELRYFVNGEDAKIVSENTYELMDYLLGLYKAGKLKPPVKPISRDFAYHAPCHSCAIRTENATIELFDKLCNNKVMKINAGCCGLAGTFGMQKKNYDLSSKIAADFKKVLDSLPAKNILTECAACKMQIEHLSNCMVSHPIVILADCY